MRTPQYFTRTIAAGTVDNPIGRHARFITVVSISASTITLAIDDDTPQQLINGMQITVAQPYNHIQLANTGGVPSTVVLYLSDEPIQDTRGMVVGAGMAASLAAIDLDTDNLALILADTTAILADTGAIETLLEIPDTPTLIPLTVVAQTGVGSTQLVAAAAANRKISIQADHDNGTDIYLGFVAGVTDANSFARLQPGDSWQGDFAGDIYACGDAGTEEVRGYVIAIA